LAKQIVGNEDFVLVYVKASLSLCEKRDVKGLYVKARQGEIKNFTGIDQIYEVPEDADLVLDTELDSIEESVEKLYQFVLPLIRF
jgi:adenylylsulfate kinase-like enzyme